MKVFILIPLIVQSKKVLAAKCNVLQTFNESHLISLSFTYTLPHLLFLKVLSCCPVSFRREDTGFVEESSQLYTAEEQTLVSTALNQHKLSVFTMLSTLFQHTDSMNESALISSLRRQVHFLMNSFIYFCFSLVKRSLVRVCRRGRPVTRRCL